MISPWDVLASVLPVYLLIVAGSALRKTGMVRKEHDQGVMRVVYTVMLPAFILDKILGSEALQSGTVVAGSVAIGFGIILIGNHDRPAGRAAHRP